VRHLNEGTLRRVYDEPLALAGAEQTHLDGCAECRERFGAITSQARATAQLLTVAPFEVQAPTALRSLRQRLQEQASRPVPWYQPWLDRNAPRLRPLSTPLVAIVLAAVLFSSLAATGVVTRLIRVFQPTQVVGVQVSPSAFPASLQLDYGQVKWLPSPPTVQQVTDAATAGTQSGFSVLTPASLPTGANGPVSYGVVSHAAGSLTFDANRLRASAAAAHVQVPAMPAKINGSTLIVNGGPALIEVWGLSGSSAQPQVPTLVIAQTRVPTVDSTVDSTGATTSDLVSYVLSQPGVPPEFAAQVRAMKDPSTTLPIPIPKGMATSEPVQVNGVQGLLIKAVFGAGVVWVKDGVIYAVGGQLTPEQVLAIASSLR
jgi:hypothetical protein